jgi:hypothetical protein
VTTSREEASMAAEHDKPKTKREYRRPKLTRFGDLRDLTRTSAAAGSMNDMTTGMNKSA